ncbi:MAG: HD domain-containing protein [Parcubacteria group bacterium]
MGENNLKSRKSEVGRQKSGRKTEVGNQASAQTSDISHRPSLAIEKEPSLKFLKSLAKDLPKMEMYLVGGMVRDVLLNKATGKDFDFVCRNVPLAKLIKSLKKHGSVNPVGRVFGVIKFVPKNSTLPDAIDIALPRQDFSFGTGGYRDLKTQSNERLPIEDDLARRDFTINAIAFRLPTTNYNLPTTNSLIDPFNGRKDLDHKVIRSVGKPDDRFKEDYSRMLRAIRLCCKLNFKIENKTWLAVKKLMPRISDERLINKKKMRVVPMETASKELQKALVANPSLAVELLDKSGALKQLMPEVLKMKKCPQPKNFHAEGDVWEHTKLMLKKMHDKGFKKQFPTVKSTSDLALICLLHDAAKPLTIKTPEKDGTDRIRFNEHAEVGAELAEKIGRRLTLSNDQIKRIVFAIRHHMVVMSVKNIYQIRTHKFAERFMDSPYSEDLMMLFYLDSVATVPPSGKPNMKNFKDTLKRIAEIKKTRSHQPIKIINGDQIMKVLGVKPGPLVGKVLAELAELKDSGKINNQKEAREFLEKNKKKILSNYEK